MFLSANPIKNSSNTGGKQSSFLMTGPDPSEGPIAAVY